MVFFLKVLEMFEKKTSIEVFELFENVLEVFEIVENIFEILKNNLFKNHPILFHENPAQKPVKLSSRSCIHSKGMCFHNVFVMCRLRETPGLPSATPTTFYLSDPVRKMRRSRWH